MKITATEIYYDDMSSEDLEVTKIQLSSGLIEDNFMHTRNVSQVLLNERRTAFIEEIKPEPLSFTMALFFEDNLDEYHIRRVKKWLKKDDHKPLRFMDENKEKIVYAIWNGNMRLRHNAINSGYIEFEFLTNSPFFFSNKKVLTGESTTVESQRLFFNYGDEPVRPMLKITNANEPTNIEIKYEHNGIIKTMIITENLSNEIILCDCENEEFETSSNLRFVYDDHNGVWLEFPLEETVITFKGNFQYEIEYQEIYY